MSGRTEYPVTARREAEPVPFCQRCPMQLMVKIGEMATSFGGKLIAWGCERCGLGAFEPHGMRPEGL